MVDAPAWLISPQSSRDHAEAFSNLVKYIVKLRRDGQIDDGAFKAIIKQAAANFVESEITSRIDSIIEDRFSVDRILEALS
jgi:hypothetical protein